MKSEESLLFFAFFILIQKVSSTSIKDCVEKMKSAIVPPKISTTEHFVGDYNYDGLKALNDFNVAAIVQDSDMTEYQRMMKKENKLLSNDEMYIQEYETLMDTFFRKNPSNKEKPQTRPYFISEVEVDLCETAVPQFLGLYNDDYIANVPYEVFARQVKLSKKMIRTKDTNPPEIFTWKCSYLLYKSTINEAEDAPTLDISSPIVGRLDLGLQIIRTEVAEYMMGKFEKNGKFKGLNIVRMYEKDNSFRVTIVPTPIHAPDPQCRDNVASDRADGSQSKQLTMPNIIPLSVVPLRTIVPDNVIKTDSPRNSQSEKQNGNNKEKPKLNKRNKKINSKMGDFSQKLKNVLSISSSSSSDDDEVNEAYGNIRKPYPNYGKSKTQKESKIWEGMASSSSKYYRKNKNEEKSTSKTRGDFGNQKTSAISNENNEFDSVDLPPNDISLNSPDSRNLPKAKSKLNPFGQNVQIGPPIPKKSHEIEEREKKPISGKIAPKFLALSTVTEESKGSSESEEKIVPLSDLYCDTPKTEKSNIQKNKTNYYTDQNTNNSGKSNKNTFAHNSKTASLTRIYDKTSPGNENSESGKNESKNRLTSVVAYTAGNITTNSSESNVTISKSYGQLSLNNSADIRSDRCGEISEIITKTRIAELADSSILNCKAESRASCSTFIATAPVVRETHARKVPKVNRKSVTELYSQRAKSNDSYMTEVKIVTRKNVNGNKTKTLPMEMILYRPSTDKKILSLRNDDNSKTIDDDSVPQSDSEKSNTKRRKKRQ